MNNIIELSKNDRAAIEPLFEGFYDTTIYSCLQGYPNSYARADCSDNPSCAMVMLGCFAFVAGDSGARAAVELVRSLNCADCGEYIIIPRDESWEGVISKAYPNAKTVYVTKPARPKAILTRRRFWIWRNPCLRGIESFRLTAGFMIYL